MDEYKRVMDAVDARAIMGAADFVAPTLMALGTRAAMRAGQPWAQTVTTNVPGPPVPLYVLGKRMQSLYPYVPIAMRMRVSIGIFSYIGTMTFGINADFDAFPDIDVLARGIRRGMEELLEIAGRTPTPLASARKP
jgi:diacylglycerol O-acyltransferase